MISLEVNGLSKRFSLRTPPAVNQVSIRVNEGEIHALTGESGSGKSTILRMIAGFEVPDEGEIVLKGKTVSRARPPLHLVPEKRSVGMVFQDNALFPHLTVAGNIGYGVSSDLRRQRVEELLELVHLTPYARRYPHEISGGQAQRVALARALAPGPDILLMDEAFNSLDRRLKMHLLPEIRRIIHSVGIPLLFVSHDRNEVFDIADRISIMHEGRILQTGTPSQLYGEPVDCYTAEFFGDANFIRREGATYLIRPEQLRICTPESKKDDPGAERDEPGVKQAGPGIEKHDPGVKQAGPGQKRASASRGGRQPADSASFSGRILERHYRGDHLELWLSCSHPEWGPENTAMKMRVQDHRIPWESLTEGSSVLLKLEPGAMVKLG
ncbi:ABC transporter ATP-binding protein [Salinispira pacifica]|uniref:Ferric iron ABC transporter, ATP-binding protein n=1 Tax=Salinispira pacifica TaxID=1307761 RepID=V5WEW1_9SPIO|nr:ABC transporter ATP-binding protein [Salinispira pacifica]AHC14170.1 Ferric iron ABC transporter, ATP-binding protein [Salinispira pacifica]